MILGIDDAGKEFAIPHVQTMLEGFLPNNITIFEFCSIIICAITGYFSMTKRGDIEAFVFIYFLFRFSYNFCLGYLLMMQSKYRSFTAYVQHHLENGNLVTRRVIQSLILRGAPSDFKTKNYPICFQAWIVFKHLENLIMWTDGWSFCALSIRCWNTDRYSTSYKFYPDILMDIIGISLLLLNYVVKRHAVNTQGAYAWFYGDFFFRVRISLLYTGIYHWIPHPMYTIGYSAYYGLALLSRSQIVLAVALIGHAMQLGFLFVVEIPHINRTYSPSICKPTVDGR